MSLGASHGRHDVRRAGLACAAHSPRAAGVRWRACPPGMVPGSHPLSKAVSKSSVAVSPTELQARRDDNRAASGLHLLVQVPDNDSTMSMPPVTSTIHGRCTQPRLQLRPTPARYGADTPRSAACIDVCRTLPRTSQQLRAGAGASDRLSTCERGIIDARRIWPGSPLLAGAGARWSAHEAASTVRARFTSNRPFPRLVQIGL